MSMFHLGNHAGKANKNSNRLLNSHFCDSESRDCSEFYLAVLVKTANSDVGDIEKHFY